MKRKPNIILIMTYQQRFDTISAYGCKEINTPNIDRIAKQGVVFNKAYAECPECVPARHALISGQHPLRTGVLSNAVGRLAPNTPTIMSVLSNNGYYCQAIGKMHFIPTREKFGFHNMLLSEEVPSSIEIDDYLSYLKSEGYLNYIREPHGMRGHMYYIPQVSPLPKEKHTTWWTTEKSIEFINNIKVARRPFFLFISYIKPHPPFDPP
ncbi:MAG TPA: sulfatase-like hydrolase/transferase, partial [Victivallales bacterium]|nr:sulfatase-like hydrolase/transferase [Victivallales bacterium]